MISAIGGVGLWSTVVVLPTIETEFGIDRGGASFPYTAVMLGFAAGGFLLGRIVDRLGIVPPILVGAVMLAVGYSLSAQADSMLEYAIYQAVFKLRQAGSLPPSNRASRIVTNDDAE